MVPCRRLAAPLALALLVVSAAAQDAYQRPPAPIPRILDTDPPPLVQPSPDRAWLLLMDRPALPHINEVAAPELRLAGDRINPRNGSRSRAPSFKGLRLRSVTGSVERRLDTPEKARIGAAWWSPDSRRIAFTVVGDDAVALWLADVESGRARPLGDGRLNGATGSPCAWVSAMAGLVCKLIPANRGPAPAAPETPRGPLVRETAGKPAPNPTYEDLLAGPADESLFEHHFASQLVLVSPEGSVRPLLPPGLHVTARPSPDGVFLLVETLHRPFSYVVPRERFPRTVAVWNVDGLFVRQLADVPRQESVPAGFDAVPVGPREVSWRDDAPATLVWAEALDGGDPAMSAAKRDRLMALGSPFAGDPAGLLDVDYRVSDAVWGRSDLALVEERWWKTRRARTWVVDPAGRAAPRVLLDRSSEDRYADPGRFLTAPNGRGRPVLLMGKDKRSAYLAGPGASPEGDRPFLDRIDLRSARTERLWRSEAPVYEEVVALLDGEARRAITRRESVEEPPAYFLREIKENLLARLTDFPDPVPELAGVKPELVRYRRADGVELSATLYLPPGYDRSKGPLPFLFWAYPREFKSASAASQVAGSPYRFTRPSGDSHLFVLTQGYGVLDGPAMPIVGEGDQEPNDTYVEQLVADAQAAVEKVAAMGVADRDRIAIGGHSYGAFMAANLLAHSNLFRAGIARSGAYNRTLTPFGFQAEERPFWKARETYMKMSPFTYADKIDEPILLIHGMADDNSGTFPIQSERLFAALKGNGATARLVLLPAEAHSYRARESVGHTLWEMIRWLDTYVKNAPPRGAGR
ncbi:MAG: S9 family peptidase [Acidobacteria bacterium]|nr:MAG: S9 family peptidase [Acidobacteriota bacterium]